MLGGYQIIDLRKIGLVLGSSQVSITDAEILKQLRGLREYIQKSHDYSRALNNSLKPILIRYRDSKNNEKREVTSFASINSTNQSLTFTIVTKHLEIEVVFEEKTDDDGNKYYDIKTAKYLYSLNEEAEGDLSIKGDLSIDSDASVGGDLSVTDDASVGGDLSVTGDATLPKINGETNPSVKPIYCHPISITSIAGTFNNTRLICLIFDNNPVAYTKETFLTLLSTFTGRVLLNGVLITASVKAVASYISGDNIVSYDMANSEINTYSITSLFSDTNILLTDNINKIN